MLRLGVCSGDEGVGGTWSCSGKVQEGGGGGGEEVVGVGVCGVWTDVGLPAADCDVFWFRPVRGPLRSSPPTLPLTGECRESFRAGTGEEVRGEMERGGGEENLRQRRGDLSFMFSPLRLFWFVAKNNSKDLKEDI